MLESANICNERIIIRGKRVSFLIHWTGLFNFERRARAPRHCERYGDLLPTLTAQELLRMELGFAGAAAWRFTVPPHFLVGELNLWVN